MGLISTCFLLHSPHSVPGLFWSWDLSMSKTDKPLPTLLTAPAREVGGDVTTGA